MRRCDAIFWTSAADAQPRTETCLKPLLPSGAARSHSRNRREMCPKLARGRHVPTDGREAALPGWALRGEPGAWSVVPYPSWLNAGDTSWQLTAATLVGLMSIPGLAVLYGGLVQRKWAVNTLLMTFSAFCTVLIAWVLWVFKMGFGSPWIGTFVGKPGTVLSASAEQAQANIPSLNGLMPKFRFPQG